METMASIKLSNRIDHTTILRLKLSNTFESRHSRKKFDDEELTWKTCGTPRPVFPFGIGQRPEKRRNDAWLFQGRNFILIF